MRSHLGKENESLANNLPFLVYTETFKIVQTKVINIISICIFVVILFYLLCLEVKMALHLLNSNFFMKSDLSSTKAAHSFSLKPKMVPPTEQ